MEEHRLRSRKEEAVQTGARHGRLCALELAGGQRADRRLRALHGVHLRLRPYLRLLRYPGDVDAELCGGHPFRPADGRRRTFILRLVRRSPAGEPADLGRADGRARVKRLVQRGLPHHMGLERAADAYAGRTFYVRGALQGDEGRLHRARLRRVVDVRGHVDLAEGRQ